MELEIRNRGKVDDDILREQRHNLDGMSKAALQAKLGYKNFDSLSLLRCTEELRQWFVKA